MVYQRQTRRRIEARGAIATLDTVYEPGEITAVAYEGEREISRFTLRSHGEPERIELTPEKASLAADGRDLLYVRVRVTDGEGITVDGYEGKLTATVEGGILMGIFSGDPKNEDNYGEDSCHAFCGEAVLVIKTNTSGDIAIRVRADGLADGVTRVTGV